MQAVTATPESKRYAKVIEVSKRIRWEIDRDVIKDRAFDFAKKFLPDGLSKAPELAFLSAAERRVLSQIQGRTYANMFGLVERFIGAKMLEHAGALPVEHRAGRRSVAAVEGRLPVPLEGGVAARDPRRARMEARKREAHAAGARRRGG